MRLRVIYSTRYLYSQTVSESHNEVRLMPTNDEEQTRLSFHFTTSPPAPIFNYEHPNGRVHHFNLRQKHNELTLTAESVALTHRRTLFTDTELPEQEMSYYLDPAIRERFAEYLMPTPRVPHIAAIAPLTAEAKGAADTQAPGDILRSIMQYIHETFSYLPGSTTVDTSLEEALATRSGVCQDFTHLMLAMCRQLGIPSRYVSGYLFTGAEGQNESQIQRLSQKDFEDRASSGLSGGNATHAWVECLLPNERWYGFDPTNNLLANDSYIKVHHGRDYDEVTPLRGIFKGISSSELEVAVRVIEEAA